MAAPNMPTFLIRYGEVDKIRSCRDIELVHCINQRKTNGEKQWELMSIQVAIGNDESLYLSRSVTGNFLQLLFQGRRHGWSYIVTSIIECRSFVFALYMVLFALLVYILIVPRISYLLSEIA